jgi:hypothetical protein
MKIMACKRDPVLRTSAPCCSCSVSDNPHDPSQTASWMQGQRRRGDRWKASLAIWKAIWKSSLLDGCGVPKHMLVETKPTVSDPRSPPPPPPFRVSSLSFMYYDTMTAPSPKHTTRYRGALGADPQPRSPQTAALQHKAEGL